jgi:phosphohistidine phosphatase
MKRLLLVRHAKSGWQTDVNADIDRKLTKQGNRDASEMAALMRRNIPKLDKIVSSPAIRAISTAQYFANDFGIPFNKIQTNLGLYERGITYIKKLIANIDNSIEVLMLVSHNPMITSLVTNLIGNETPMLEPCSVVCIDYNISKWNEIENVNGKLIFIEAPVSF